MKPANECRASKKITINLLEPVNIEIETNQNSISQNPAFRNHKNTS